MKPCALAAVVGLFLGGVVTAFAPADPPGANKSDPELALDLGTGVKLELVLVPAGSFMMGDDTDRDAKPAHKVAIAKPFYLGKHEVTQEQWRALMGRAHAATTTKGDKLPLDTVEWWEAQEFCAMLGAKFAGRTFRLPSEAEWEYACRAGTTTKYCSGDEVAKLVDYAWFRRDDDKNPNPKVKGIADTHPVGEKKPNAWGLHDMHGNVWEWCHSGWKGYPYDADDGRELAGPRNPDAKKDPKSLVDAKVLRGGSWHHSPKAATSYNRACSPPADHRYYYGFRVALNDAK